MALFDTLQSTRKLRANGASEPLAEATVEVIHDATEAATSDLATRADLAELKADLYRAMWIFGAGIVTINLTAIGAATGLIIAFG